MIRRTLLALLGAVALGGLVQAGELSLAPANSPPPAADPRLAALVGEYGGPKVTVTVYEQNGELRALRSDLPTLDGRRIADPDHQFDMQFGRPAALHLGDEVFPRTDVGADTIFRIRIGLRGDPARLRAVAMSAAPPAEPPPRAPSDLVDLSRMDPTLKFDIRYATTNNFMGFPLYERAGAFLQRPAAEALVRANAALKPYGYGLMIHDGYRPWFVTKMFWDATPPDAHVFVADPAKGSRHNRGCAVDLTLYDLNTGQAVEMTGLYDEMSPRSYADYRGGTSRQRWLRGLLRREMEAQGFVVYPEEWWHFDYGKWADYAIGTVSFTELSKASATAH